MLRTALKPRWIALLVVVLLAATGMALLGEWQFRRATAQPDDAVASAPARPIGDVIRARQTFPAADADAMVTAAGRWDPERQLLVADRRLAGRAGLWVLTPLVLADGSAVPVVRGWVPDAEDPAVAPPSGEATVTGSLRPGEPAAERAPGQGSGLPEGQIDRIDLTGLIRDWPHPLITGYVVQTALTPAPAAGTPVPEALPALPESRGGIDWRNLSYALQWWVFAGCGLFFWFRLVQDDHLGIRRGPADDGPADGGPDDDGPDPQEDDGETATVPSRGAHP